MKWLMGEIILFIIVLTSGMLNGGFAMNTKGKVDLGLEKRGIRVYVQKPILHINPLLYVQSRKSTKAIYDHCKGLDMNQARMKNPVAFVRVQEKVKTTSIVDIFRGPTGNTIMQYVCR